ncbi:MAG: hypothetical protein ACE5PT_00865 [Gemmatimonadales bacterium]
MNDLTASRPTPADEDPLVHRYLAALPRYQPMPDFADRVLLGVWRPIPPRIRSLQARLAQARWPWVVLGLMAAGSFLWQVTFVTALAQHPEWRISALDWIRDEGWPAAWRWLGANGEAAWSAVSHTLTATPSGQVAPWAAAGMALLLGCAIGLYLVMRSVPIAPGGRHGVR